MNGHYRNSPIPLGPVTRSFGVMLARQFRRLPHHPVFAYPDPQGQYHTIDWQTFYGDICSVATFLHEQGIGKGDRVAVFSPNSYQMLVWEMAVTSMGAVSVPIFAGYDVKNLDYILGHAEPRAIYLDGDERLEKFEACNARTLVETVVTRQPSRYTTFEECLKGGSRELFEKLVSRVKSNQVCFIQYTSGTTGEPKGVMLTHRNIMSQQKALSKLWKINTRSRFLSYLPWHHSFGGLFERFSALYNGATLYLEDSFGKDLDRLLHNWRQVRPTQFFSVPKIYIGLVTEARLRPEVEELLFHPDLEFVFTAAAPLPQDCGEYFKAHGIPVLEGWGLTETSPCVTLTPMQKERVHSYVGEPIPGCEILTTESGEILVRGPNVMRGYYKMPERTARVIDEYGWFHTGDLGEITDYGLRMICRVDGLFKLSNGEKVSSMLVENRLTISSQWIQFAVAVGAGQHFVASLLFPNFRNLKNWARQQGKKLPAGWELARDSAVRELVTGEIRKNMEGFQPKYMQVGAFVLIPKELTLEAGELTPTMKVIRHQVLAEYRDWIEAIYKPERHPDKQPFIAHLKPL